MTSILAWLAPWIFGFGMCMLAFGRPRHHGAWCAVLGVGWLLGMLLTATLLEWLHAMVSPQSAVLHLGPWLAAIGIVAALAGWRWRVGASIGNATPATTPWLWRIVAGALLLVLAWHGWLLFAEAHARPLFPWDAWLVWSIKPKTWYLLDQWTPFVNFPHWLTSASPALHTDVVPAYPELLAHLEVWFASGAGCWCDPAFTIVWPALWLAMLVGGYGMLRTLGCRFETALLACFALGSLPMINTHAALAGYSDLWLAATFGFTLLCWQHWQRSRHVGCLLVALVFGLSLPAIKVEGGVLMMLWLAVLVLGTLPRRWRRGELLGGAALLVLLVLGVVFGGIGVPLPGIGWVHVDANHLQITELSSLSLGWHPVTGAVLESLLTVPNWHLLFWLAPMVLVWRWRTLRRSTGVGLMALCLLGDATFLFVLFFLTGAGAWASDYSSINRLLLQMVPALVFLLALLFAEPGRGSASHKP